MSILFLSSTVRKYLLTKSKPARPLAMVSFNTSSHTMQVTKRDGRLQPVSMDKIIARVRDLCSGLSDRVDAVRVAMKVVSGLYDGIPTRELDEETARIAHNMITEHPDYDRLAARIAISNMHKDTRGHKSFLATARKLRGNTVDGKPAPIVADWLVELAEKHADRIHAAIVHKRDYTSYTYFGWKTLERSYLLKMGERVVERPQNMWMRVALGIHGEDIDAALDTYEAMSTGKYTHASPTLFNAGTPIPQMASCFAADTMVETRRGPVAIQNVRVGDEVMTHMCRWRKVVQLHTNKLGDRKLMKLERMYKAGATYVTDNHRFWCVTEDDRTPRWIAVRDMIGGKTVYVAEPCDKRVRVGREYSDMYLLVDGVCFTRVMPLIHEADVQHETVYTLGVEEDHSYGVEGMVAENCFLLRGGPEGDSIDGIFQKLSECAGISKTAGGIGMYFGDVRPNGAYIRGGNGTTSGIVGYLQIYNQMLRAVDQNGRRKGAGAFYIEPWHGDIEAFLELRLHHGDMNARALDIFTALTLNDMFMERVRAGGRWSLFDVSKHRDLVDLYGPAFTARYEELERQGAAMKTMPARALIRKIITSMLETGTPYLVSKHQMNAKSNQQNLGTIVNSNLCVTGETMVLTDKGHLPIVELVDKEVNVWNGERWSAVTPRQTNGAAEIWRVELSNGASVRCTDYHRWAIQNGAPRDNKPEHIVHTKDLEVGMKLPRTAWPVVDGDEPCPRAYTQGMFSADGTVQRNGLCTLALYGEKMALRPHLDIRSTSGVPTQRNLLNTTLHQMLPKDFVPINSSVADKLAWMAGYLDGDGCAMKSKANPGMSCIQYVSIDRDFMERTRLMLQTLGVDVKVVLMQPAHQTLLPDGRGGHKMFDCKPTYRSTISFFYTQKLLELGLRCNRLVLPVNNGDAFTNASRYTTITSVTKTEDVEPTYCFNEPLRERAVFNGIYMAQCSEIIQYSDYGTSSVCNLASLALSSYVGAGGAFDYASLAAHAGKLVRNLNRVIDRTYYPDDKCRRANLRDRPMGIGVQGLANVFFKQRVAYGSAESRQTNRDIFEAIYFGALDASCRAAEADGAYESYEGSPMQRDGKLQFDLWDGETPLSGRFDWDALRARIKKYGVRNSLLVALMPTASSASILGNVESFEPPAELLYQRDVLSGTYMVVVRELVEALEEEGLWDEQMEADLLAADGSVQGIARVPQWIKDVFRTAYEVPMDVQLEMRADRERFVCQSASGNAHMLNPSFNDVYRMIMKAFELKLKTDSYYLRTGPAKKARKSGGAAAPPADACRNEPDCLSCQG